MRESYGVPYGRVIKWCVLAILGALVVLMLDIAGSDRLVFWSAVAAIGAAGVALIYSTIMWATSRRGNQRDRKWK